MITPCEDSLSDPCQSGLLAVHNLTKLWSLSDTPQSSLSLLRLYH